jgi:hypothetical protein
MQRKTDRKFDAWLTSLMGLLAGQLKCCGGLRALLAGRPGKVVGLWGRYGIEKGKVHDLWCACNRIQQGRGG